jgi:hypothetical protein
LLYSFHPVDLSDVEGDWKSSDPATIKEFYHTVEKQCSHIEKIELKKGQKLCYGELNIEVLYTYHDLYPEKAGFNDYSTVIITTVEGQRILWLGDTGRKGSDILLQKPEQLKCDMVQVAHHGIDNYGNMMELYKATSAKVVLWPAPDYGMVQRMDQAVNSFILNKMNVIEHHVSGYGTVKLPLPYAPGTAEKFLKACHSEKDVIR